jgi:hypothetical protein
MSASDPKRILGLCLPEPLAGLRSGVSFAAHEVRQSTVAERRQFAALADAAPPYRNDLEAGRA